MRATIWRKALKRTKNKALVGLIFAMLSLIQFPLTPPANAAVGTNQQINFQGKVVNPDGTNIPNGTYNIEFKIYQDGDGDKNTAGETLKWTESRLRNASQGVTITDGIFQVNLGAVNTTLGTAVDFNQDTLWFSINLGSTNATCTPFSNCSPDGEMNPYIRFTATPYALNSGKLEGKTSSQFVQLAQGVQTDASTVPSVFINKTGASGNILQLQRAGSDIFTIDNAGTTITIGTSSGTDLASRGSLTIKSTGAGNNVTIDGSNQFVVQDTAVFNADSSFVLNDSEKVSTTSTITGSTSVNVQELAVTNNTTSGVQNGLVIRNEAGSGATESLLLVDNADTDTAVAAGLTVQSAAGAITTALDVSDAEIVNAINIGSNNILSGGTTITSAELNLLDGHNVALVDVDDAVSTAIVGTGALNGGSITSGFGAIDTGADAITTTGTVTGGTVSSTAGFTLQGASGLAGSYISASNGGFTSTLTFANPTATRSIILPDEGGTVCIRNSVNCGFITAGTFLAKNQTSTETSSGSVAGDFYQFSNTNTGAVGVLALTNSGSGNTLKVTSAVNPAGGSALIFASNTNASVTGNLIDLQSGASPTSKFAVSSVGNVSVFGTYNSNTFTGSSLQFGASATATIQPASGQALNITANAASTWSTTGGALTLTSAAAATWGTAVGNLTLQAAGTNTLLLDTGGAGTVTVGTTATTLNLGNNTGDNTVNIASSTGNDIVNILTSTGTNTLQIGAATGTNTATTINGTTLIKSATNSATALQVQRSDGAKLLVADTASTNQRLYIGDPTADSTYAWLVLDNYNQNGNDPAAGTPGAMYYNASNNTFRCYRTSWSSCASNGTLQDAYDAGNTLNTTTTTQRNIHFNLQDSGVATDSNFAIDIEAGSTGFVSISQLNGGGATAANQLLLIDATDANTTVANGLQIQATANDGITDAIDVSDADLLNAINVGNNNITGTAYNITSSGTINITPGGTLTVGASSQNLNLVGNGSTTLAATTTGVTNTLGFAAISGSSKSILIPNEAGTLCIQGSVNCGFATSAGKLNKDSADTSTINAAGNLYSFTNSNTGAAGVLSLTGSGTNAAMSITESGTGSAISITQSGNPSAAAFLLNNTNASPAGNLVDLQTGGSSRFSVNTSGNVTAAGTYNTNTFTSSSLQFGASSTASIQSAASQALNLTGNAASTWSTSVGALTLTSAAAATWSTTAGNLTLQGGSGTVSLGTSSILTAAAGLTVNSGGTGALTLRTADSTTASTGAVSIRSGNATIGSNLSSGSVTIDSGTKTGTGTAGSVSIGGTNAPSVSIGQTATNNSALSFNGVSTFKPVTDSATAFQIQNAAANNLLTVDTTNLDITVEQGDFYVTTFATPSTPSVAAGANTGGTLSGATGTTYYYKLTAVNARGESVGSGETSIAANTFTPHSAPSSAAAGSDSSDSGNVANGTYRYAYTYVTANGETTIGTASGNVVVDDGFFGSGNQVSVTGITVGPVGTTQRKLYRCTGSGCTTWGLLATINDNTTTSTTDNTASAGAAPPGANTARTNLNNATVTFSSVTGATSYRIYRSTTSGTGYAYQTTSASPFTDTGAAGTSANPPTSSGVGRIGVGTSTPTATLDVRGDGLFRNSANSATAFQVQNASSQNLFTVDTSAGVVRVALGSTGSTNAICSSLANATAPTAGTVYELRDCNAAPAADYAEAYPVAAGTGYGDIVAMGTAMVDTYDTTDGEIDWTKVKGRITQLVKSNSPYQASVVGVVSDNHGDFTSAGNNIKPQDNPMPVALNGRVPVKVAADSKPIQPGDYLTTSPSAGKGMKAEAAGFVIGKALSAWEPGEASVMVFVEPGYYPGPEISNFVHNGGNAILSGLSVNGTANFSNLNASGAVTINNLAVQDVAVGGDLRVVGMATIAALKVSGSAEIAGDINFAGVGQSRNALTKRFKATVDIYAGDVVIADTAHDGQVTTTVIAGDTKVLGVALTDVAAGQDAIIAIGGSVQVKTKETATANGDLLVSSDQAGKSAKAANPISGSIVGKALGKADPVTGLVWILITLH